MWIKALSLLTVGFIVTLPKVSLGVTAMTVRDESEYYCDYPRWTLSVSVEVSPRCSEINLESQGFRIKLKEGRPGTQLIFPTPESGKMLFEVAEGDEKKAEGKVLIAKCLPDQSKFTLKMNKFCKPQ
jgi:hypothetical protein